MVEAVLVTRGDLSAVVSLDVCVGGDDPTDDDTCTAVLNASFWLLIFALVEAWRRDRRRDLLEYAVLGDTDARSFGKQFFDTNADRYEGEPNAATPAIFVLTTSVVQKQTNDDGNIIRPTINVRRNNDILIGQFGA